MTAEPLTLDAALRKLGSITSFVWRFPAIIADWYDGDTCHVHRGAWPGIAIHGEHVRVEGLNAPEIRDAGGPASRDHAAALAPVGTLVTLTCTKQDKYGRLLARIVLPDGSDFSERMIADGFAVRYL
jgi:endonuclease YncB( thermonuclease family)